jgi:hypothetical protein
VDIFFLLKNYVIAHIICNHPVFKHANLINKPYKNMLGLASDVDGSELGLFLKELSSIVVCCSHFLSAKNVLKYQIPLSSMLQSNSPICSVA